MSDVDALRARLVAAREAARTADEVCAAVADVEWFNAHGEAAPEHPTPAALATWLPECSADARTEADAALTAVLTAAEVAPPFGEAPERYQWAPVGALLFALAADLSAPIPDRPGHDLEYTLMLRLEATNAAWRAAGGRHPLAPLVAAWQRRPPPAEWDSREHPVLSGTLAGRDGGLRPLVMANDPRQLPLSLMGGSEPRQLWLGFEQPEPDVPVLPLVAFDRRGGISMTSGAGAAHAIRLYVEALLAVPPDRRNDGSPIPLRAKLRDVVTGLWPRGWQRGRDWPRLLAGLDELRRLGVEWEHGGTGGVWFAVTVRSVPREDAPLDDLVQFEVQLPPGSGPGPMVAREHLRLLGLDSAPAYRLYLSLCWLWGPPRHSTRTADRRRSAATAWEARRAR